MPAVGCAGVLDTPSKSFVPASSGFGAVSESPRRLAFVGSSSAIPFDAASCPAADGQPPAFVFPPTSVPEPVFPVNVKAPDACVVSAQVVTPLRVSYPKHELGPIENNQVIIPPVADQIPLLKISEICDNATRFVFEGKILNKYGTYKLSSSPNKGPSYKVSKYLKCDLGDIDGCNTITLSIVDNYISLYESKIIVGAFIRVEGPVVKAKNRNDGGTCAFSLQVDATTSILKAEPFDCNLSFYPEVRIKDFLEHASQCGSEERKAPYGTLAFVVINFDNGVASGKNTQDLLTIADGPSAHDRAAVSIVVFVSYACCMVDY